MTSPSIDSRADAAQADLLAAAVDLDSARMRAVLLQVERDGGVDHAVTDVLVPVLREIGERWHGGHLSVMHEHHASSIIRSFAAELQAAQSAHTAAIGETDRKAGDGDRRPAVVLACPPGELHDLPLHLFGLMLGARGWRTFVLGANTPWGALAAGVRQSGAQACVLSGIRSRTLWAHRPALAHLSRLTHVYLAGPAASGLEAGGFRTLSDDWRAAADTVCGAAASRGDT